MHSCVKILPQSFIRLLLDHDDTHSFFKCIYCRFVVDLLCCSLTFKSSIFFTSVCCAGIYHQRSPCESWEYTPWTGGGTRPRKATSYDHDGREASTIPHTSSTVLNNKYICVDVLFFYAKCGMCVMTKSFHFGVICSKNVT